MGDPLSSVQLIDKLVIPTFVIDRNHQVTHWNTALAKASGLSAATMLGTRNQWMPFYKQARPTLADLLIDGYTDSTIARFYSDKFRPSELIEGAYVAEDFFPDIGQTGEWLSFSAAPVLDSGNRIIAAIETLTNISDRKRAEQTLLERERIYRELSMADDLTGLYNARQLRREVERHIELCRRYQQPMAVAMLDLDHFKQINDSHGHLFGDEVLRAFGDIIRRSIRNPDDAFRYGGEEFVVLMPFSEQPDAFTVAERIRSALFEARFLPDSGETLQLSVSGGITQILPHDSYDSLLQRADSALYKAKQQGRNQIVTADEYRQAPESPC